MSDLAAGEQCDYRIFPELEYRRAACACACAQHSASTQAEEKRWSAALGQLISPCQKLSGPVCAGQKQSRSAASTLALGRPISNRLSASAPSAGEVFLMPRKAARLRRLRLHKNRIGKTR